MNSAWSACSLLLLTSVAVCSGRNASEYFQQAQFQRSPSRPADAVVFLIPDVPPLICEPHNGECVGNYRSDEYFCLSLPHGYSFYKCWFEGNSSVSYNLDLVEDSFLDLFSSVNGGLVVFRKQDMYCTSDSQLPDEYFQLRVQRPLEYRPLKCRLLSDRGIVYLKFPEFPTVVCQTRTEAGRYHFHLPCIDEQLHCAFRVYSELPLGDTNTEERLSQSLIDGIPCGVHARPSVLCSRHVSSSGTAHFHIQLLDGTTFDCNFPNAVPRYLPETSPRVTIGRFL